MSHRVSAGSADAKCPASPVVNRISIENLMTPRHGVLCPASPKSICNLVGSLMTPLPDGMAVTSHDISSQDFSPALSADLFSPSKMLPLFGSLGKRVQGESYQSAQKTPSMKTMSATNTQEKQGFVFATPRLPQFDDDDRPPFAAVEMTPVEQAFWAKFSDKEIQSLKNIDEKQPEYEPLGEEDDKTLMQLENNDVSCEVEKEARVACGEDTYEEEKQAKGGKDKPQKKVKIHPEEVYERESKRCKTNARAREEQKGRGGDALLKGRQNYIDMLKSSVLNSTPGKQVKVTRLLDTPAVREQHRAKKKGIPTWEDLLHLMQDMVDKKEKTYKENIIAYMQEMFGDAASSENGAAFMAMYSKSMVKMREEIRPISKQQKRKREGYEQNQEIIDDVKAKKLVLNENLFPARMWGPLRINKLRTLCDLIEYCGEKQLFGVKIARETGKTEPVSGWSRLEFDEPLAFVFFTLWREGPSKKTRKTFKTNVLKTMRDELMMRMWMVEESKKGNQGRKEIKGYWKKFHMRAEFDFRGNFVWTAIFGAGLYKKNNEEVSKITIIQQGKDTPLAVCEFKKDGNKREVVVRESESDIQTHSKENIVGSAVAARVRKNSSAKDDSADSDE